MTNLDDQIDLITQHIRAAGAERRQLRIRAGGSKDFYGQNLQGELLDVSTLRGVVSYEPSELVVTVRAATPLAELEVLLARQGQHLAFEAPDFSSLDGTATCGGAVAAGLSGPARASAGAVRDFVLGVRLINGRGQHLTFGGQVMKNVAGYDVSRLMVGAMGTLGLLTEISLKVLPIAPAEVTLMCADLTQQQALDTLHRWGAQPLPLNASCWVFDETASPPRNYLFVRLRGAVAAVEAACPRMMADVHAQGGAAQRMDPTQAQADWQSCRDHKLPFFQPPSADLCLWRLSLPQTAPVLDLPYAQLVEWHGGQRWLWAPWKAHDNIRKLASAVGGTACVFRLPASQNAKSVERFQALSPAVLKIHQALKAEFDPDGIFNRGRIHNQY